MNFNLSRIGAGGALLIIVGVSLAVSLFKSLFGAVEGTEFSSDKLFWIAQASLVGVIIYGGWMSLKEKSVVPRKIFYLAVTLLGILAVSIWVIGPDLTEDILKKSTTTAQEIVRESLDSSPSQGSEVAPTENSNLNIYNKVEIDKKSAWWDFWSTTPPGEWLDRRYGKNTSGLLWIPMTILGYWIVRRLFRSKESNSVSSGSNDLIETIMGVILLICLGILFVIAVMWFFDKYGLKVIS